MVQTKRRKSRRSSVALPWEERGSFWRRLLAGPRWKVALVALALVWVGSLLWRAADERARVRQTRLAISETQRAVSAFRSEVGRCPRSTTELLHPPRSRTRYLRNKPRDGWGRQLWVRCPAQGDPDGSEVVSAGPSGDFLEADNIQ
ncbi:MAG: hypothetical protein CMN30_06005 [Sandaracinus sp.]|nr:hypothetical protein [Sandaracinus sp.]|tara:strand:+ start:283 stop:720 length:438 start_codon:yes stop_codon:yes gene_type:complete